MEVTAFVLILIVFLGTILPMRDLPGDSMKIYPENAGIEHLSLNCSVKPLSEFSSRNIVKQQYDYSCGSAALATLLNAHLGESLSEEQVVQGLMRYGDPKKIEERRAFSLLDMKRFVEVLGYKASGYKAEFEDLKKIGKPAIVPIEFYGYKHFVVFRGIYQGHVFVADPFMGNTSYTVERFVDMWPQKIVFVVSDGDLHLDALKLTNEDLRIIDIDMAKSLAIDSLPPDIITEQRQFIESLGVIKFRTVNVK